MSLSNNHIISNKNEDFFDVIIKTQTQLNTTGLKNIGSLLFDKLSHRDENAKILLSHVEEVFIDINLSELRHIISNLHVTFHRLRIKKGETVLLASMESNSEIYIAILFLALTSFGVKVFLPMYLEKDVLEDWYAKLNFKFIVLPGQEIFELDHNERQKKNINHLIEFAKKNGITRCDIFDDLRLNALLVNPLIIQKSDDDEVIRERVDGVSGSDIAMMITTSGTSGESKIVSYDHNSFLVNISAWEKAGLFHRDKLGGRGFTPLFTHTMGIRSFLNGLWLGKAVILINTEWFSEKPESVSYFLKQSKPEHVTGGPAVFNMFLEMCRVFPDLKKVLRHSLKTIVSSGTSANPEVIEKMIEAFNIQAHNAFGTTETQQVLNTLIENSETPVNHNSLGGVFPGASIGLKRINNSKTYKLFIKSDFGGIDFLDRKKHQKLINNYIYLGDTVKFSDEKIFYFKREKEDYLNDEFGMKVPLKKLKENYNQLFTSFYHIKILPLKFRPGLAVIIFLNEIKNLDQLQRMKIETQAHTIIEKINHDLYKTLEPIQFNHWTINRFSVLESKDIQNRKGIVSDYKIGLTYSNLINDLTKDNQPKTNIIVVRSILEKPSNYSKYHNPYIGKLLKCLDMDVSYDSAKDDYLYWDSAQQKTEILDLTGGYGTNLLGHHNEELINHAIEFLKSKKIPLSDQLSLQKSTGELAEKLNDLIGRHTGKSYYTLFGSTGSEVVEIAIHHAYLEWTKQIRKLEENQASKYSYGNERHFKEVWNKNWEIIKKTCPKIIANQKAFHGTTTGARSLMGDEERRNKFNGLFGISTIFIDDLNLELKEQIASEINNNAVEIKIFMEEDEKLNLTPFKLSTIIAAIVEPVLGEGGICEIDKEFPAILSTYDFPLIVDEIQSGLGRTGSFLSSNNFIGNYYLFSKSLGGNISKISAISIEKERFIEEIGKLYVSTFADGAFAANIALESLKIIDRDNIPKTAGAKGNEIIKRLRFISSKYPDVIEAIQGKGLMIGIKFSQKAINKNLFLRILYHKKVLGYLFSSYLLNNHKLRILPSISAPDVLRIEPSICIGKMDVNKLLQGIEKLANLVDEGKFYQLTKHLMKGDPFIDNKGKIPEYGSMYQKVDTPMEGALKVAFIAHFAYPLEEFRMLSDDLCNASDTGLKLLFSKFEQIMDLEPITLNARNIYNGKIHLTMMLLPTSSAELEKLHKTNRREKAIRQIQKAVNRAATEGIKVVSLGGYNSIITNNGKVILEPEGTKIVTGNTLTAVIGYHNFKNQLVEKLSNSELNIGIVGATGNIGRILARKFIDDKSINLKSIRLFGRNNMRLNKLIIDISLVAKSRKVKLKSCVELSELRHCNAIIIATNTNDPIVYPEHIDKNQAIIITDLSIPAGISDELQRCSNVQILPFASSIALPEDPDFLVTSCSPRGTALCCVSEAILNGLENISLDLRGDISLEGFNTLYGLAKKHDFMLSANIIKSYKSSIPHEFPV